MFRQHILPALDKIRPELAGMYCADNGREAVEPVILAGVTLLQFIDRATDVQAVGNIRMHLGWKYALGLELPYAGFHPTTLLHFRQRLIKHKKHSIIFDGLVAALQEAGLVPKRSKQRVDSTHVLAVVSAMSRLEVVRETLRLCLEMIEKQGRAGALDEWALWIERYRDCTIDWRRQTKAQLQQKMAQAGREAMALRARQVRAALERFSDGTYGACLSCEENVGYGRLKARPETPFCIACQTRREQR